MSSSSSDPTLKIEGTGKPDRELSLSKAFHARLVEKITDARLPIDPIGLQGLSGFGYEVSIMEGLTLINLRWWGPVRPEWAVFATIINDLLDVAEITDWPKVETIKHRHDDE